MISEAFLATLLAIYVALMLVFRQAWLRHPQAAALADFVPRTKISVIVPARNEAENIRPCLDSILANDYPPVLLEIIVVDDDSTDETHQLVSKYAPQVTLLSSANSDDSLNRAYKKKALSLGISESTGEVIVTTDADCEAPKTWLREIAFAFSNPDVQLVAGPVRFTLDGTVLSTFQYLDFMTMQGITAATHQLKAGFMSNGANLSFRRAAYEAVKGYQDISVLASGDDMQLTRKIGLQFPGGIRYLLSKLAIIDTAPQSTLSGFLQQRIRWASKNGKYKDHQLTAILTVVYLLNAGWLLAFIVSFVTLNFQSVLFCLVVLGMKTLVELLFLYKIAGFFGQKRLLWLFPALQILHISYITAAGFFGFFGVYTWKGRRLH